MATVKAVLRKKSNPEGEYPVAIRITKDRRSTYLGTGQYVAEKYWDRRNRLVRKTHPNAAMLNQYILSKVAEANQFVLDAELKEESRNVREIKKKIIGKSPDFFEVAQMHLVNLQNRGRHHQYDTERGRLDKFREFIRNDKLPFDQLTVSLLRNFEGYLIKEKKRSSRTAVNYFILIRTIYNLGISEGIVDRSGYPFGKGKITIKIGESEKIGLNRDEIRKLENARNLTPAQQRAVHVWLVSFYFAGIRVGDVLQLKWTDFNDGRLLYRMNKNSKLVSLKIPDKAKAILDEYRDQRNTGKLVFPFLSGVDLRNDQEVSVRTQSITRNLNRRLKAAARTLGISKKMSMHIARHSFGNISGDTIPIQMLQKLYRHSSVTTTIRYQANFIHRDADEALDKVVDF
ncbi:site-specific integrase [Robiginitalea sp. M366]|uniref:site-specific integrase n=1 Tax=Robiginitalea aestuariiviva TaxID=3036903 RepID=UPI00240E1DA2|nr:site-specific integrase [Robiginitalea aestuariiviva]MDG1571949.1 site-specific integrase [Robiginitalea aestuariiviva]